MSRALDKDVVASLKAGNPLAAYQAISGLLLQSSAGDGLLEIEILGRSHPFEDGVYLLQDGPAVGISKVGLVQAFLVARKLLMGHHGGTKVQTTECLFAATAVLLLMDPEHLTAANTRKRLLRGLAAHRDEQQVVLEREKRLVDSLLTSRLHRHTKSPTLWNHRRWLLLEFTSLSLPVHVHADITSVVLVAAERHPRNYYAWCHARFLMSLQATESSEPIIATIKKWCFQHHTDISGWSFLYFLLSTKGPSDATVSCSTFAEVLGLVSSLHLANESVWVFLRTLTASGLVDDQEYSQFKTVGQDLLGTAKESTDLRVLRSALDWCETYRLSV
ncbi:hypothetical protein B0T17DRAFT_484852 [Bombardia bombarda]|uniref:Protein prenyltransferase alpha subunit repeat-containing protein 1 n=1 Tax=Bombardia bombarda TaxID=252184 RepID=A0AA39XL00_9PEZI|nr:hypothetical protein B0T17DRAFT_484852 [Bombardia bombarda]